MKNAYDVIVVGAGPAGLTAAKAAAENGLAVALVERKDCIHEILRMCGQMIVSLTGKYMGERVNHNPQAGLINFPHTGFSLKYDGPTKDFYSWHIYSPNEETVLFGDYEANKARGIEGRASAVYSKQHLLAGLVDECRRLGVQIFSGENVIDLRRTADGVEVLTASGKHLKSIFAIDAGGRQSRVARVLGVNKCRGFYGSVTSVGYEMTNLNLPESEALHQPLVKSGDPPMMGFVVPRAWDHEGDPVWLVMITNVDPDADHEALLDDFIGKSRYARWFKGGTIVRRCGCAGNMYSPIVNPYQDNVLFVGDAGWCQEAEMTGAAMSGFKAGTAVVEAMLEKQHSAEGVASYIDWWKTCHIDALDYRVFLKNLYMPVLCSDEEIDYIFGNINEKLQTVLDPYEVPESLGRALAKVIPVIQKERPALIKKMMGFNDLPAEVVLRKTINAGFNCAFTT